ncbi:ATP-binding protein [Acinetobacter courvalinii]|uniref:ATP-binding protein n=1 Tax=Acinetobacter courvalinii TaxID=280147 RepID=UPI0021CFA1F6|nr:ATP-binding protein [Acinetobacter courvalinii]MCU4368283.1 ATP-binding protein [Acinetobacter courvalinii]MCU4446653.1 ATP-binding protein [Acinetobacter courvalinii]
MTDTPVDNQEEKFEFKPRARLLAQLGDQLIKNEHIAIVELVKNSYDADAIFCKIVLNDFMNKEKGSIAILDNGNGMNIDVVKNAWLEPGSDSKLDEKKKPKLSPIYKRLPIGEKGIGRFGVHKLGDKITLITKKEGSKEVHVEIDWGHIENVKYLEDFPIKVEEKDAPVFFTEENLRNILELSEETSSEDIKLHGTYIFIENLKTRWDRLMVRELARTVNSLQSPFKKSNQNFKVELELKQNKNWLEGIESWESIKERALFNFNIHIRGSEIVDFYYEFMPFPSMLDKVKPRVVTLDNNEYINSHRNIFEDSENKQKLLKLSDYKIGDVIFQGYIFDLDALVMKLSGVLDRKNFRDYLKSHTGVKVFRDSLRVYDYGEQENDWLGLDKSRFQDPSKAISNNLIVGAVHFDREKSSDLLEKTNREGFVENDAYIAMKKAVLYALNLVINLRHEDKLALRKALAEDKEQKTINSLVFEACEYVENNVKEEKVKKGILNYFKKFEEDYETVKDTLLLAAGSGLSLSVVMHEVEKIVYEVQRILIKEPDEKERVSTLVKHLSTMLDGYSEIVKRPNKQLQNLNSALDQALFNIEFRKRAHRVSTIDAYKSKGNIKLKYSRPLIVSSIQNLLDNSIYWLDHKSEIEGIDYEKKIFIDIQETNHQYHIVIADNGGGFKDLDPNVLMEPFVSFKPDHKGMGLGLHITQQAMISNNGVLNFPSFYDFEIPEDFLGGALVVLSFNKEGE